MYQSIKVIEGVITRFCASCGKKVTMDDSIKQLEKVIGKEVVLSWQNGTQFFCNSKCLKK